MKTQKISQQQNSQYFKGNVFLTGKFSKNANAQVERALPFLKEMFKKKKYDLFINEDIANRNILFTVKNGKSNISSTVALVNDKIRHATAFYCDMANFVSNEYEKSIVPVKFSEKVKNFFNNSIKILFTNK